ncbi:AzlC family ABC transporter permease [Sporomusa termitida]|uniref:Inner membrane protein YgaZ n=1 Tax=Sporomusa termitida TaxID=2377 RepID=A0A517DQR9_9FIRM|nr:AzlC family ABC transporter permease [Sporomusa termitida]QDR79712.1 Inner membrane protein YgaZ [Sporomusa termitida]
MDEYRQGVRDSLPVMLGVVPFGITCGIMGLSAGLTPVETVLMSLLVFAGAAQFIGITMLGAGLSGWGLIVFTTLLINLRHLLMGMSLAPYLLKLPLARQLLLTFSLTDEAYAVIMSRTDREGYNANYQMGSSWAFYIIWAASTTVGVLVGSYIPDPLAWGLDFAMPATFLAMLMPRLTNYVSIAVCSVAAIVAVVGAVYLPGKWYIIAACLAASITGGLLEKEDKHAF